MRIFHGIKVAAFYFFKLDISEAIFRMKEFGQSDLRTVNSFFWNDYLVIPTSFCPIKYKFLA